MITCSTTIYKEQESPNATSSLIIGTEQKDVMFLDPSGTNCILSVSFLFYFIFCVVSSFLDNLLKKN